MKIIIADDYDINIMDEDVRKSLDAYVCRYIHTELKKYDGWRERRGVEALDIMIREAVSYEVKHMIARELDKIVKGAIKKTALSIRNNPKYEVIKDAVAEEIAEQTDCSWK